MRKFQIYLGIIVYLSYSLLGTFLKLVKLKIVSWANIVYLLPNTLLSWDSISTSVSISLLLWYMFDKWFWHWIPFYEKLFNKTYIAGKYKGVLYSNYKRKEHKKIKDVIVTIKQTFENVEICIDSNEQKGYSIISKWHKEYTNSDNSIFYIFETNPYINYKKDNPIKYGGAKIIIKPKLRIEFWTEKNTGYIKLKKI